MLADCGDVTDPAALKDMLCAYVALSRVRRADGLLLLRAFSPYLFAQGPPPGPHCLMKLLRARLGDTRVETYSLADASSEYKERLQRREEEKEERKRKGLQWSCFDCGNAFPAEAFGASASKVDEIYASCVAHGHWVCCRACSVAHEREQHGVDDDVGTRTCEECGLQKRQCYFEEDGTVCMPCVLVSEYVLAQCGVCHKVKYNLEFASRPREGSGENEDGSLAICLACMPSKSTYTCTVCKEEKSRGKFHARTMRSAHRKCILRCKACFKCEVCGETKSDARVFDTNTKICSKCSKVPCLTCKTSKARKEFPESQLHNVTRNQGLRCKGCLTCSRCLEVRRAEDFSAAQPRCLECDKFSTCEVCHKEKDHQEFPESQLDHVTRNQCLRCEECHTCVRCDRKKAAEKFARTASECTECSQSGVRCDVCGEHKERTSFPKSQLLKAWRNKVKRCRACHRCAMCKRDKRAESFEGDGDGCKTCRRIYLCHGCESSLAGPLFEDSELRRDLPFCRSCKDRLDAVNEKMADPSAWRCTCSNPTEWSHADRCTLKRNFAGERRWTGRNVEVSEDDAKLWAKRHKKRS